MNLRSPRTSYTTRRMQNARVFFTLACMLVGVAIAPGCDTKPNGGNGGEGGEPTGVGGTGVGGAGVGGSGGGGTAGGGTGGTGTGGGGTAGGSNASSSSSSSSGSGGDVEPPFMNGMTAAHNAARASVSPAPSVAIPPLTWSGEVAAVAQAYAENCVFQHSNNQYGENLFATSGGANPQGVVDS
ncbi:MAG TPA: CAP domain-containing protein, partial [Polyangium sp.]|nr:CAP domain-containing protein [Polyangium sp.]